MIDAAPDARVRPGNVRSFVLVFGTRDTGLFEMTGANADSFFFDGSVSADGRSIAVRDLDVATSDNAQQFGCDSVFGTRGLVADMPVLLARDSALFAFRDSSETTARAALRFTAREMAAIPLPARLPLPAAALGLLAVLRRRAA